MRSLACLISIIAALTATAQSTPSFSIKAGTFVSTNGNELRIALGAEWQFVRTPSGGYSISGETYQGVLGRSVPICLNAIVRQGTVYAEAGIGASWNDESPILTRSRTSTEFAWRIAVGADLGTGRTPAFVELVYSWSGSRDQSGLGLFFGLRF